MYIIILYMSKTCTHIESKELDMDSDGRSSIHQLLAVS